MSSQSQGPGWWMASDGKWYPPEQAAGFVPPPPPATVSASDAGNDPQGRSAADYTVDSKVTLQTAAGSTVSLEHDLLSVQVSRRDARRTKEREFSINLAAISRVLFLPAPGGKVTTGWVWFLRADEDQQPEKVPTSGSPLHFQYFGGRHPDAEALVEAVAERTAGRLAPSRLISKPLGRFTYPTEANEFTGRDIATSEDEPHGKEVAKEIYGVRTITIYERGFAKVAFIGRTGSAKPERLISIEASTDLARKKSGAGRTAGFVLTGGLNMLTSNKKGDIFLTIVTDQQTHVLQQPASNSAIKTIKKLEAAGNAALSTVGVSPS